MLPTREETLAKARAQAAGQQIAALRLSQTTRGTTEYNSESPDAECRNQHPTQISPSLIEPNQALFSDITLEDIEARVRLAAKVKSMVKPFIFNSMHLALFIYAESAGLASLCRREPDIVADNLRFVEPLLKLFLSRAVGGVADGLKPAERAASIRDGHRCVVTGSSDPHIVHIWPFLESDDRKSWLKVRDFLDHALKLLFDSFVEGAVLGDRLIPKWDDEPKTSAHKAANTLCLNEELHACWDKSLIGLKPTAHADNGTAWIDESTGEADPHHVQLLVEGRWLPSPIPEDLHKRSLSDTNEKVTPFTEACLVMDYLETEPKALAGFIHARTRCPPIEHQNTQVEGGYLTKLKVNKEHLEDTKLLLKGQWMVVQMAALSGAAEVYNELDGQIPPEPRVPLPPVINFLSEDEDY